MRTVLVDVAVRRDLVGGDVADGVGCGFADIDLARIMQRFDLCAVQGAVFG